jgi:hypothetical protein
MLVRFLHFWLPVVLGLLLSTVSPTARAQIDELPRPDSAHAASFGVSVALGDSLAVVGASGEAVCGPNAGAVYVFERVPGPRFDDWRGVTRLTPDACRPNAFFGERVVLSGRRLLVSASPSEPFADDGANAAYMFARRPNGTWQQTARLEPAPDRSDGPFAADIDLDGDRAVVSTSGTPEEGGNGTVYVYDYDAPTATWQRTARLTPERGVDLGIFGQSVALSGDHLAVAASTYDRDAPGSVHVFERDSTSRRWRESALLRDIDSFLIELDLFGSTLLVGEDRAGEARTGRAAVYTRDERGRWPRTALLRPSLPYDSGSFGTSVSLGARWALVTGYGEQLDQDVNIDRVVYVFRRTDAGTWAEHSLLDIGQIDFGAALDQHGDVALVSSVQDDATSSVYVVQLR